ncbi:MAG: hypothetical protein H0Z28_06590 [Archaeoglobus sp.]|nr:hypothetical protein [Archaeoglobus sp.]
MAKRMESKGARLLAILLALIMIGSVLTYAAKRGQTSPQREVEFNFPDGFNGIISHIPAGADQVVYVNLENSNPELSEILKKIVTNNMDSMFFSHLRLSQGVERFMVSSYSGTFPEILYLIDVNRTKVFYTHDSEDVYNGYKIKSNNGISLVDQTSPFLLGTTPIVAKTLDVISGKERSLASEVGNFTERMPPGDYNLILMFKGDAVRQLVRGNASNFFDFYLAAYRINASNPSYYEKVVLMNFIKSGGFVSSNKTAYYSYENFKDGLSIAIMGDTNLTKLMQLEPEMRIIEIQQVEPGNAGNNSTK